MTRLQFTEHIINTILDEWIEHQDLLPQALQEKPLFGIKILPELWLGYALAAQPQNVSDAPILCVLNMRRDYTQSAFLNHTRIK